MNFTTSNLSKIAPKFRTSGAISQPRRKAGSPMRDIGITKSKKVVNVATPDDYLAKMYYVLDNATDSKMKQFAYEEIRKILIQRGEWRDD
jgi:hypothetical protein